MLVPIGMLVSLAAGGVKAATSISKAVREAGQQVDFSKKFAATYKPNTAYDSTFETYTDMMQKDTQNSGNTQSDGSVKTAFNNSSNAAGTFTGSNVGNTGFQPKPPSIIAGAMDSISGQNAAPNSSQGKFLPNSVSKLNVPSDYDKFVMDINNLGR